MGEPLLMAALPVPMAGLPAPNAMVLVGPPLLARAVNRGSVAIGVAPPKLVAVRIRLFTPLVVVVPVFIFIVKATKSETVVSLWPMMVLLITAVAVAPSPKT